jgi:hypothetical protein
VCSKGEKPLVTSLTGDDAGVNFCPAHDKPPREPELMPNTPWQKNPISLIEPCWIWMVSTLSFVKHIKELKSHSTKSNEIEVKLLNRVKTEHVHRSPEMEVPI